MKKLLLLTALASQGVAAAPWADAYSGSTSAEIVYRYTSDQGSGEIAIPLLASGSYNILGLHTPGSFRSATGLLEQRGYLVFDLSTWWAFHDTHSNVRSDGQRPELRISGGTADWEFAPGAKGSIFVTPTLLSIPVGDLTSGLATFDSLLGNLPRVAFSENAWSMRLDWDYVYPVLRDRSQTTLALGVVVSAIPEPSTYALLAGGLLLLGVRYKKNAANPKA